MPSSSTAAVPSAERVARLFDDDLATADDIRSRALSGLQRLRLARMNHARREQTRLSDESGPDDPEALQLQSQVVTDQRFGRELGAEIDRTKAGTPEVDAQGWILHGHVRDPELRGLPKLTVALYDQREQWIKALGYACTDATGYFLLHFGQTKADGEKMASSMSSQPAGWSIHVSDAQHKLLYRSRTPIVPVLGQVIYRAIVIDGDGETCVPPAPEAPPTDSGNNPKSVDSPPKPPKAGRKRKSSDPAPKASTPAFRSRKRKG